MGDFLDVEKTPVGLKADLPQCGQVFEKFADAEVTRVVDGCLGSEGAFNIRLACQPALENGSEL